MCAGLLTRQQTLVKPPHLVTNDTISIRRALISVSDKAGIVEFATALAEGGAELLSTGGTARALRDSGLSPVDVSTHTGAPEILDGRVKTLHPKIHGGLLGRNTAEHMAQMKEHSIDAIDLVCVNLYPFEKTVAQPGVGLQTAIENIDIGGPSMLRSAAKNYERVVVIIDPSDYSLVLTEISQNGGVSLTTREELARKVFAHTARYDGAIAAYLTALPKPSPQSVEDEAASLKTDATNTRQQYPGVLTAQWSKVADLRYGENPHQSAAFYQSVSFPLVSGSSNGAEAGTRNKQLSLAEATILQGKAVSYNNFIDIDAALACCQEFSQPTAVVVKHTNPCGVASASDISTAYTLARQTDPTSSFGGIVAVNRAIDSALAGQLVETFLECIVAPSVDADAQKILSAKKNLRVLTTGPWPGPINSGWALRSIAGGLLVQMQDGVPASASEAKVVTDRSPTEEEMKGLDFIWRVGKHVKSNCIVFGKGTQTRGIGAGQMSRVDAAHLAQTKAKLPLDGTVVASDAFFPFRDGLDVLAKAGATAVIQPGGSRRDDEVIAAANEHGMAMVMTGMRHFRH